MKTDNILKHIIITSLLIVSTSIIFANPVDRNKAGMVAKNFMTKRFGSNFTITEIVPELYHNTVVVYYVNFDEGGWVMVSANDMAIPVLAYSQYGKYDIFEEKPDNYVEFVSDYYEHIKLLENETTTNTKMQLLWKDLIDFVPDKQVFNHSEDNNCIRLLGEPGTTRIAWGQSTNNNGGCDPSYNAFFPGTTNNNCYCGKRYAGCGSVAMGQIMWYWGWPYTSSFRYYDWDKMPKKLLENTSSDIADEVGHLLKDCADASNMHYLLCEGSWTTVNDIKDAFTNTFRYEAAKKHVKSDWETDSWLDLIRSEIDAGRPVFYRGDKSDLSGSKHFFVIDGYSLDDPDYFYFNFGWKGSNDGLYCLDAITPTGHGPYNENQKALVGISPTYTSTTTINDVLYQSVSGIEQGEAQNAITLPCSGKVLTVNDGGTLIHVAGNSIVLKNGFHAKEGSFYRAFIDSRLSEVEDIEVLNVPNVITPNGDGINDELQVHVQNANSWELIAYDRNGNTLDHSAGFFSGEYVNVWDGGNLSDGTYYCSIRFKNNYGRYYENDYPVYIFGANSGSKNNNDNRSSKKETHDSKSSCLTSYEKLTETAPSFLADNIDGVYVYPNPFLDVLSVSFDNAETNNEIFIYDFFGILKYHETNIGSNAIIHLNAPQGIYLKLIKSKCQSHIYKLIKL